MLSMNTVLNNRELVIIFWSVVIIVFAATKKDVRKSFLLVLKQFFNPKIIVPLLISTTPVLLILYVMERLALWDNSSLKETIVWAIGAGIVMFFNSTSIKTGKELLKKSLKDSIKLVVLVEFIVNFYVFPIAVEFFLVPLITILVLMQTVAGFQKDKKYEPTKKFLGALVALIGLVLIIYACSELTDKPNEFFTWQNLKLLLLPIMLTIAYIPSVYLLALYGAYESLFIRIDFFLKEQSSTSKLKAACAKKCLLSVSRISKFTPYLVKNLMTEMTQDEALKVVRAFRP
jgi:hypothetical protein